MMTTIFTHFASLINKLPLSWRQSFFISALKLTYCLAPKMQRTFRVNLDLVYPELTAEERERFISKCLQSWGRVITDVFRAGELTQDWITEHSEFPDREEFGKLLGNQQPESFQKGGLILTAHLSTFEMLLKVNPHYPERKPPAFIARNLKPAFLNQWWRTQREKFGATFIERRGAIRKCIENIRGGRDVAVVFDQNVVRKHAVFVDWFGHQAATTKGVAEIIMQTNCPALVMAVELVGVEQYKIKLQHRDFSQVISDDQLTDTEKRLEITRQISADMQKFIREAPEDWFWLHQRWKTRELETDQNFYKQK